MNRRLGASLEIFRPGGQGTKGVGYAGSDADEIVSTKGGGVMRKLPPHQNPKPTPTANLSSTNPSGSRSPKSWPGLTLQSFRRP